jgi:periplasmic protein TonB
MPRDLFGDVTRPSISIGNRKRYAVPVSLLSHAIVLAMIVIVPILAAPMMPGVLDSRTLVRIIDIVPPTPPPPPIRRDTTVRPIEPPGAPIEAPTGISKEIVVDFAPPAGEPVGWIGGSDNLDTTLAPPPIVAKTAPQEPVRIGGTIRQPLKVRNVDPVYPAIAQAARVQGIVIIEATLSPDGRISNARILRSIPLLDQAALDAVRQWEYTPTLLNGVPVPVIMTITVMFTLSK